MAQATLHIVIIDDDRFQVTALQKIVTDTGLAHTTSLFGNGQEAIDFLNQTYAEGETLPDLIFLDINMPVMNAWKFLEAYNKIKRHLYHPIPVYVVTSSTDGFDMAKSRHHDIVKGYLIKPVAREKVRAILEQIHAQ